MTELGSMIFEDHTFDKPEKFTVFFWRVNTYSVKTNINTW